MSIKSLNRHIFCRLSIFLICLNFVCSMASAIDSDQPSLRMAWSSDGLDFTDGGREVLNDAAQPSIVRLRNGDIILLCERSDEDDDSGHGRIVSMRSRNDGRRWSRPKLVQIRDKVGRRVHGSMGSIVLMPDGRVQLFFFRDVINNHSKDSSTIPMLASAISRDGVHFRLDEFFRVEGLPDGMQGISAAWIRDRLNIYLTPQSRAMHVKKAGLVTQAISTNGRRFVVVRQEKMGSTTFQGSIVNAGKGYRAYAWNKSGILSYSSSHGRSWKKEKDLRLDNGTRPAVVSLDKQAWLMVYEYLGENLDEASDQIAEVYQDDFETDDESSDTGGAALAVIDGEHSGKADDTERQDGDGNNELVVNAVAGSHGALDEESSSYDAYPNLDVPPTYPDGTPVSDEQGFAPRPNFRDEVDYIKWWEAITSEISSGRTYDLQEAFSQAVGDGEWPAQSNMYADLDFDGPPVPWDPAEKPKWESSRLAYSALRSRFKEAADYDGYSDSRYVFNIEGDAGEDFDKLLINFLLPNLAPHRTVFKSTMSDAWRLTKGKVSAEHMLDAWRTTLVNARHVGRGATLIEELVATAENTILHKTARWALKYDVFSGEKISEAFDVLKKYDRPARDPMLWIRGEHAMVMDVTQYLFGPPTPGRDQQINKERIETFISQLWVEEEKVEEITKNFNVLTFEEGKKSIIALDRFYRRLGEMMRIGYPDVRAADIEILQNTFIHQSPIAEEFIPWLSRYYTLLTRLEASRRATQLIYAVHGFKAQEKRWPKSLDELPDRLSGDFRIDPYSGEDFVYRLSADGPRIYSVSENGVDDGGIHSRRWEDTPDEKTGSDDYVFWPPQP